VYSGLRLRERGAEARPSPYGPIWARVVPPKKSQNVVGTSAGACNAAKSSLLFMPAGKSRPCCIAFSKRCAVRQFAASNGSRAQFEARNRSHPLARNSQAGQVPQP
jgi:hypothetical protein